MPPVRTPAVFVKSRRVKSHEHLEPDGFAFSIFAGSVLIGFASSVFLGFRGLSDGITRASSADFKCNVSALFSHLSERTLCENHYDGQDDAQDVRLETVVEKIYRIKNQVGD